MFLRKNKRPDGRTFLAIVKGYRDPLTKKSKSKTIMSIGFLKDLYDKYNDPIAHFEQIANEMTLAEKAENAPINFSFDPKQSINTSAVNRKNLGFAVLSYFYHKLKIDYFWNNRQKTSNCDFNLNHIF